MSAVERYPFVVVPGGRVVRPPVDHAIVLGLVELPKPEPDPHADDPLLLNVGRPTRNGVMA